MVLALKSRFDPAVMGLASAVAQGMLMGLLIRHWGEAEVIKIGSIGSSIGFVGMMLAATDIVIFLSIGFFGRMIALLTSAVTALTIKMVDYQQEVIMGLSNSFMSAGQIVRLILAGFVYDVHIEYPYISGAMIFTFGFLVRLVGIKS